jgi:hypothetical protein
MCGHILDLVLTGKYAGTKEFENEFGVSMVAFKWGWVKTNCYHIWRNNRPINQLF